MVVGHRDKRFRFWSATLLVGCAVMVTSCSKSSDVWIANPCDAPLEVRTFNSPPDKIDGEEPYQTAEIPAMAVGKIDNAFSDAAGHDRSIEIVDSAVYPANKDELDNDTFVVPAEICGAR